MCLTIPATVPCLSTPASLIAHSNIRRLTPLSLKGSRSPGLFSIHLLFISCSCSPSVHRLFTLCSPSVHLFSVHSLFFGRSASTHPILRPAMQGHQHLIQQVSSTARAGCQATFATQQLVIPLVVPLLPPPPLPYTPASRPPSTSPAPALHPRLPSPPSHRLWPTSPPPAFYLPRPCHTPPTFSVPAPAPVVWCVRIPPCL